MILKYVKCDTCPEQVQVEFSGITPEKWQTIGHNEHRCPNCIKVATRYKEWQDSHQKRGPITSFINDPKPKKRRKKS